MTWQPALTSLTTPSAAATTGTETPPEGCGRRQWMLTVADNGRKLTEAEKACLMHSLESVKPDGLGLGLTEAAAARGITPGAARTRYHRARAALRSSLPHEIAEVTS